MNSYIALFRGINVSGKKIIKMEDLRKLMEAAGYADVKTYIQSGNVIFGSSERSKEKLGRAIEKLIEEKYGFEVSVFVIDKDDLEKAIDNNPFAQGRVPEEGTKKIYVTFLNGVPSDENIRKLKQGPIGDDLVALHGGVLYLKLSKSAADTKLTNSFIESKLKLKATTRNWNTTLTLLELVSK